MTDERDIPDLLDEIGALLDVEPSAAFAANVRNAIDRDAPRRFSWRVMVPVSVGVAIAAVGLAIAVRDHPPVTASATRVASHPVAPMTEPSTTIGPRHETAREPHGMATRPRVRASAEGLVDLAPVVTTIDGIDVIVPADQRLALARLVSGVRSGRFSVPGGLEPKYDADGLLLPLTPVAISAIPDPVPGPIDSAATQGDPKGSQREKR